jgi:DNA polymerase III subunit delta'
MKAFEHILGQETAVATLRRALERGRVHHAYRFEGPDGVGKEVTALALAQALLCEHGTGCGECSACRRVNTLSQEPPLVPIHPDVLMVGRGLYTGTLLSAKEATGISVEQIRKVVLGRAGYPPHEGRALFVLVRDADELTTSAANALLKTLEEPQRNVHFVLLTSRPNRLLDTIRSRTLAVRFGALPDAIIQRILERHQKSLPSVQLAQGSASLALTLADSDEAEELARFSRALEATLQATHLASALEFSSDLPKDKHVLTSRLLGYAERLALENRSLVEVDVKRALGVTRRYELVQAAVSALERNAAPALAVEAMIAELRRI